MTRTRQAIKSWGSVAIACAVTVYFLHQNLMGIHESSGKALKIMIATTIMGVDHAGLERCDALAVQGPVNPIPVLETGPAPKSSRSMRMAKSNPMMDPDHGRTAGPARHAWQRFPKMAEPIRESDKAG